MANIMHDRTMCNVPGCSKCRIEMEEYEKTHMMNITVYTLPDWSCDEIFDVSGFDIGEGGLLTIVRVDGFICEVYAPGVWAQVSVSHVPRIESTDDGTNIDEKDDEEDGTGRVPQE